MKELRIAQITAETRAEASAEAEGLILTGRPIVYDQPTTINDPAGKYIEIIRSGALDGADLSDVRLLYNHDFNKIPLARTPKTMSLSVSPAGLDISAELPNTEEARAVHTAVKRGDLSGMSFTFTVPAGGDKYNPATNTREIFKISKVYETSIVPFPAYPQTSVEARTAIQEAANNPLRKQAKILINQIKKVEV